MRFLGFLAPRRTAPLARERLQLVFAHDRAEIERTQLVATLQEELLGVIAKHTAIDRDKVQLKVTRRDGVSTLDLDIELPLGLDRKKAA